VVDPDAVGNAVTRSAIIVGGGWAGLSAASKLIENGWHVTLLERSDQLGGRTVSYWNERFGEWLDNGTHLFAGAYTVSLGLLEKWGSLHSIDFEAGRTINWLSDRGSHLLDLRGSLLGNAFELLGFHSLTITERLHLINSLGRLLAVREGSQTVFDVISRSIASAPRIAEFWDALTRAVMNAPIRVSAAEPMAEALRQMLNTHPKRALFGLPMISFRKLIHEPALKSLSDSGVVVKLKESVQAFRQSDTGFTVSTKSYNLTSDVLILALPLHDLNHLLPQDEYVTIFSGYPSKTEYSAIAGIHYQFDRPVISAPMNYIAGDDGIWIMGRGYSEPGGWSRVSAVLSCASRESWERFSREEQGADARIRDTFPSAKAARIVARQAIRTVRATPLFNPDANVRRPPEVTNLKGLFVCGDWCATGLPATIEGAARSGGRAASEALKLHS
jgi:squalene-associated FAD-dependent desaturase